MSTIILFAPLIGALICGFGWRFIGEFAGQVIATGLLFLAAFLSWIVFFTLDAETTRIVLMRWFDVGSFGAEWAIRLDRLTAIMLVVVTTVSALVHLYSFGYMAHDDNWHEGEHYKARFFAYLSFFTFAMLMLVTSDNLVQMFFGWEGVGVASYLLIGFYYRKPSANAAAIKAFVVNRVGDFGFALGIFALFFLVDSVRFDDVFAAGPVLAETQPDLPVDGLERGQSGGRASVHRGDGQVGAAFPAHLAARRDGGADAGVGADPCRDDGHRRRVPCLPDVADL
jgi:NADH-quinone oxidoreductase subunit L